MNEPTAPAAIPAPALPLFQAGKVLDGRSHSQPIDHGWLDVARYALDFLASNGLAPGTTHNMHNPDETLNSR
jgi:hypothetical protein